MTYMQVLSKKLRSIPFKLRIAAKMLGVCSVMNTGAFYAFGFIADWYSRKAGAFTPVQAVITTCLLEAIIIAICVWVTRSWWSILIWFLSLYGGLAGAVIVYFALVKLGVWEFQWQD